MRNRLIRSFSDQFGHHPHVVVRVPGRINLMGRHVDHQGGDVNMLAIDRAIFLAASPGRDQRFQFRNREEHLYPACDLNLEGSCPGTDQSWQEFIEAPEMQARSESIPLWCRYLAGAMLRLERHRPGQVPGLQLAVDGDLPPAAGLSSSSALTLGAILAADALFRWELERKDLIQLVSESEWFAGIRGGTSDAAAMLAARPGQAVRLGCLPFSIKSAHSLPSHLHIILANSHESAEKGAGARNDYNWRVAAYRIAFKLLLEARPAWKEQARHLRDIQPETLSVPTAEIYRALRCLPARITRHEFRANFSRQYEELEYQFSSHEEPPGGYPLRDICLYGLAEIARAKYLGSVLDQGDRDTLAEWLRLSHDGDRVSVLQEGARIPWRPPEVSDDFLSRLIQDAEQEIPRAELSRQTGAYQCSTPGIDTMVDICQSVAGCLGAQILGAGLGGSIMALVEESEAERVMEKLAEEYYRPRHLPPRAWSTLPGSGAEVQLCLSV